MLPLSSTLWCALLWFLTSPASCQADLQTRAEGGLITIGEAMNTIRGLCESIKQFEKTLATPPFNLFGDVALSMPIPVLNPLIMDPFHFIDAIKWIIDSSLKGINTVENVVGVNLGKRALTTPLPTSTLQAQTNSQKQSTASIPQTTIPAQSSQTTTQEAHVGHDAPKPQSTDFEETTSKPKGQSFLLTIEDVMTFTGQLCPWVDFFDSFFTTSIFKVFHLHNLPLLIPDGTHAFDLAKIFQNYFGSYFRNANLTPTATT